MNIQQALKRNKTEPVRRSIDLIKDVSELYWAGEMDNVKSWNIHQINADWEPLCDELTLTPEQIRDILISEGLGDYTIKKIICKLGF